MFYVAGESLRDDYKLQTFNWLFEELYTMYVSAILVVKTTSDSRILNSIIYSFFKSAKHMFQTQNLVH